MSSDFNNVTLHQLVESQAAQRPQSIAVTFADRHLTYAELNQKANQLAHYLRTLGVKPETFVGVCIERSLDMVISLLGILKAGGAYVPLDPTYPKERLSFIIEDTKIPVLITQSHLQATLPTHTATTLTIDTLWSTIAPYPTHNPDNGVTAANLAYTIYTSGSTGKPKGVLIEHGGAVNTILDINQRFQVSHCDRALAVCSLNFDLSVYDMFGVPAAGGTIVLPPPSTAPDPETWGRLMQQQQITLWNSAPPVMQMVAGYLSNHDRTLPASLRLVLLSGDWIPLPLPSLIRRLKAGSEPTTIINLGGATEASIWSCFYQIEAIDPEWRNIPYGRPLARQQFYILDDQLHPVAEGETGELFIGGAGVARGYLNRPELNETKFLADSFSQEPGARLYRTGDLGRYLPDGNIEFLGRIDHQVKIRGFRVELGEIEAVLTEHVAIEQVLVVAQDDVTHQKRLVAYLVTSPPVQALQQPVMTRLLRNYIKQKLPDYMVPSAFVLLEGFPLTANGKIDRCALPIPKWTDVTSQTIAPRTLTECQLVEIWQQLLSVEKIGIHDSFFELGGHSLLAVHLMYQVNQHFQIELSLTRFLEAPTIADMAQSIELLQQGETIVTHCPTLITLDPTICPAATPSQPVLNRFLTGVTGFLGAYLLHELLQQTQSDIYCLVRANSLEEGRMRIQTTLKHYRLWQPQTADRIIPVLGDLSQPHLGIASETFNRLAEKLDVIYHCGAWVNMAYPYSALAATNVLGTQEVLRLASQSKTKPVHFVSTIDVYSSMPLEGIGTLTNTSPAGPIHELFSGYAQTKYHAEQLVMMAHDRGLPVTIYRPSAILGDSRIGICQASDFIVRMIKGCIQLGVAPALEAQLNLIPVDYASRAIVQYSQQSQNSGQTINIVNPQSLSWTVLLDWINQQGYTVKTMTYETWYAQLLRSIAGTGVRSDAANNALTALAPLLTNRKFVQKSLGAFHYDDTDLTLAAIPPLESLLQTYFTYFVQSGFLTPPAIDRSLSQVG